MAAPQLASQPAGAEASDDARQVSTSSADHVRTAQAVAPLVNAAAAPDAAAPETELALPPQQTPGASPLQTAPEMPRTAVQEIVLPARPAHLAADVGLEIVRQVAGGKSDFTIRLDPPEMGRIEVKLELAPTGEVRGVIAAENPATHELLRRDEAALYRLLAEQGLKADSGALSFQQRQQQQQPVREHEIASEHGRASGHTEFAAAPARRSNALLDLVT